MFPFDPSDAHSSLCHVRDWPAHLPPLPSNRVVYGIAESTPHAVVVKPGVAAVLSSKQEATSRNTSLNGTQSSNTREHQPENIF